MTNFVRVEGGKLAIQCLRDTRPSKPVSNNKTPPNKDGITIEETSKEKEHED